MNASEGLMRIAVVVRWCGYLIAALCVVGAVIAGMNNRWDWQVMLMFLIPAALSAGGGWTLAWIVEGFAKPKS